MKKLARNLPESPAFRFVLIMGLVDLFGDTTYSGGASMNGLFLASLGASAAMISTIGGLSEFLNYLTRGLSGYVADLIRKRWPMVFAGYAANLLAVPALALAGYWQIAAGLILLQGIGRGARKPLVQAMLSYATGQHGRGWVYGVHTALDHGGRAVGPLLIAAVLFATGTFHTAYALLLIPAALAFITLAVARVTFPTPSTLERQHPTTTTAAFTRSYWLYLAAGACFAAGLMNFELISFHLSRTGAAQNAVPLFLALATGSGALASLGFGRLYDRIGLPALLVAVVTAAMFSPFVFLLPVHFAPVGMVLWGVGQVTQDMLLTALVAGVLPRGRRDLAFGLYYAGYGLGWLIGAVAAGLLYEQSRIALVAFAAGVQLASVPIFMLARRSSR